MRQRDLIAGVLMILILGLAVLTVRVERLSSAEGLGRALRSIGATATELRVDGWCQLKQQPEDDAGMIAVVKESMAALNIGPGQYRLTCWNTSRQRVIRARGERCGSERNLTVDVKVIAAVCSGQDQGMYMLITVQQVGGEKQAADWQKRIAAVLEQAGESAQINTCLVGYIDGKLEKDKWQSKLADAGRSLGTTDMDMLVQQQFASVTGYSPLFPDEVQAGDKLVNLNMAIRFSPYENRTYVIAGSPAISGEY